MSKQNEIPAEMMDAAKPVLGARGYGRTAAHIVAEQLLKVAGVPALLAERDGLRARVAELEAVANDLFPLALAHAAVYQVDHELPDLHARHSEIIERAKTALGGFRS